MGGCPTHAVLTLALNPMDENWMTLFHQGLENCAVKYGVSVVGGDIAAAPEKNTQVCSLTILGTVERKKLCLRRNVKPGDWLYATGTFGNSFESQWHLDFEPRLEAAQFLAGVYTGAMMDVSDGLQKDLCRMAEASGCAVHLLDPEHLPCREGADWRQALTDGEDYELIFSVDPALAEKLEQNWPFRDLPLTRIGVFLPGKAGVLDNNLQSVKIGYDHFHES